MFRAVATEEGTVLVPLTEAEIAARVAEEEAAANAPPVVPSSVSMRQARLALLGAGLLDAVEAYMETAPQAELIEWDFATDIHRNRDLVANIGSQLGLTDQQIDALFLAARAIP